MKQVYCSKILSNRKNELQRQILEAVELSDEKKLSLLKFQCAHRYGLQTMTDFLHLEVCDDLESPSHPPQEFDQVQLEVVHQGQVTALEPSKTVTEEVLDGSKEIGFKDVDIDYSRSFNTGQLEARSISEESKSNTTNTHQLSQGNLASMQVPPPPRTAPNRLRRWLPSHNEDYPKAS